MALTVLLRLAAALGALAGLAHVVIPGRLLALAGWGYDRVLAVDFRPRENATTRVRLIGVALLLASALLASLAARLQ